MRLFKREFTDGKVGPVGRVVAYTIMGFFTLLTLLPLFWLLYSSFKSNVEIIRSPLAWPERWTTLNYSKAWKVGNLGTYMRRRVGAGGSVVARVHGTPCRQSPFRSGERNRVGAMAPRALFPRTSSFPRTLTGSKEGGRNRHGPGTPHFGGRPHRLARRRHDHRLRSRRHPDGAIRALGSRFRCTIP